METSGGFVHEVKQRIMKKINLRISLRIDQRINPGFLISFSGCWDFGFLSCDGRDLILEKCLRKQRMGSEPLVLNFSSEKRGNFPFVRSGLTKCLSLLVLSFD